MSAQHRAGILREHSRSCRLSRSMQGLFGQGPGLCGAPGEPECVESVGCVSEQGLIVGGECDRAKREGFEVVAGT